MAILETVLGYFGWNSGFLMWGRFGWISVVLLAWFCLGFVGLVWFCLGGFDFSVGGVCFFGGCVYGLVVVVVCMWFCVLR